MSIIDSNKKFTHQEKKLIENFITKTKKESPINDLTFEYNLHVPESVYKVSYDIPRGNLAAEKLSDRMLSDKFVVSDFISYHVLIKGESIDTINFIKYVSKKIVGKDIVTIEIVREKPIGNYGLYGMQYADIGVRLYYTSNNYIPKEEQIEFPSHLKVLLGKPHPNELDDYQQKNGCGVEILEDYLLFTRSTLLNDLKKLKK